MWGGEKKERIHLSLLLSPLSLSLLSHTFFPVIFCRIAHTQGFCCSLTKRASREKRFVEIRRRSYRQKRTNVSLHSKGSSKNREMRTHIYIYMYTYIHSSLSGLLLCREFLNMKNVCALFPSHSLKEMREKRPVIFLTSLFF